jgi:F-type H+-transporting ATPase subunit epsilon
MARTFKLNIITPDKDFFNDDVEMVIVRTVEGDMGILGNHEPVVAPLAIGSIRVKKKEGEEFTEASCSGGFINITEDIVDVVTDSAEWADEIDLERAETSLERAKERFNSRNDSIDVMRAKLSLTRAMNRINVAGNKNHHERG